MSRRVQRAEKELQQIVAEFLVKQFPMSDGILVTVTRIQLSPDLRRGRVFVTFFAMNDDVEQGQLLEELQSMAVQIQSQVAKSIRMKFNPKLVFEYDQSQQRSLKVEGIIREISNQESHNQES